ncbi:PTS lactose/cellobiose transporter subunit IIA [Pantoea sp. DY-15]|uniref:PTS lactose/cellobiose transporter subunit IIA n=1 Tax=unclassified Pantoea TaxID=2630326 RepID=UPI001C9882A3|nr:MULTISPECIES: PTS lactose/cellobiose transporter subunit IIA [unclassified Pantoea]MBY4840404.1 PTS lactose/cellobiose transporter subunit IIA [Pantoea sp. DY-5]MBY4888276.1 PTS lactose/cellobiose transporter subunit IIA [Pantoea sp. DY-15]
MSEIVAIEFEEEIMLLLVQAGAARSAAISALRLAREGRFDEAQQQLAAAGESISAAHQQQTALIGLDEGSGKLPVTLILVHAQDHLMNAMLIQDLAGEIIELYRRTAAGGTDA